MDIKQNLQTIILTDELAEINTGYFILPYVKALRVGWRGYILSSNFHSMFIQRNIIYNSRFFLCGY
jgi:glucose-6-phosphate-specific signal transduction histidine kinase